LVEVVFLLITQPEQVAAFGSVGREEGLVATINQYLFAPVTEDHENVGVVETSLSPLEGEIRVGAESGVLAVVKLQVLDQALVNP